MKVVHCDEALELVGCWNAFTMCSHEVVLEATEALIAWFPTNECTSCLAPRQAMWVDLCGCGSDKVFSKEAIGTVLLPYAQLQSISKNKP